VPALSGPRDFADVTARAVGGVVNISSQTVTRSPFANDPFWQFFFGGDEGMMGAQRSTSLGSGVVVSSDGYVVTNNHVIGESLRGNPEINVVLPDKRELRGRLIGTDPMTDIALVKIGVRGLPVISWGDSSKLRVGQWVLAIGSPFQLNQTVTLGIVSALGRRNVGLSEYEDFIQTDAAINPGNSGGALIDERGDLVGINTAILSETGGYQGIGFAVPSNLARRVVDELIRSGYVRRGSIGMLQVAGLTTGDAEYLGLADTHGAYVTRMARSGPAYEAGIRPGDVIVGFNGTRIEDPAQLLRLLADATIGSTATVDLIRRGRRAEIRVPIVQGGR
jgi:serine protease Do